MFNLIINTEQINKGNSIWNMSKANIFSIFFYDKMIKTILPNLNIIKDNQLFLNFKDKKDKSYKIS